MLRTQGAPTTSTSVDKNPVKLLLVDDHPVLRLGIKTLLCSDPGLEVVAEADNGQAAVQLAAQLEPDLVIMDLSLPIMTGLEATRAIKAASPERRILILSHHDEPSYAHSVMEAGADGYVLKRSAWENLLRAVREVVAGGRHVDGELALEWQPARQSERAACDGLPALSVREDQVMRMLTRGLRMKEVASELAISMRTLETYKARAMAKLRLQSRAELMRHGARVGWLKSIDLEARGSSEAVDKG